MGIPLPKLSLRYSQSYKLKYPHDFQDNVVKGF
jgi:hypothetical protein